MKRLPTVRRFVVAFFSENDTAANEAAVSLRHTYPHEEVTFYPAGEATSVARPHANLRLPDEALVCLWVPVAELSSAIQILQGARARSIFLTAGGAPERYEGPPLEASVDVKTLLQSLERLQKVAATSREYLVESIGLGHPASPAAQWVVDNTYVIDLGIRDIRQELRRTMRKLPVAHFKDLLSLAHRFVDDCRGRVTDEGIRQYLTDIQQNGELGSHQIWSFPLLVRVVLVEKLVGLAARASRTQQLREEAFLWADRIAHTALGGNELLQSMVNRLDQEPFARERSFAVALAEQLQEQESALHTLQFSIEKRMQSPLFQLVRAEHEREAEDSLLAANAFGGIKNIARINFRDTFEAVSLSHAALLRDPSGIYAQSDFKTRDRARQSISSLALRAHAMESQIAATAVGLAEAAPGGHERNVLYYLLGPGIANLEAALSVHPTGGQSALRWLRGHSVSVYLVSIFALTAAFTFVATRMAWDAGIHQRRLLILLGVLAAFPLSEFAIQAIHSLIISIFPPEHLPKLNFEKGIPADAATLVVVPMMLSSAATIQREAEKLEIRFLANREAGVAYALFADFCDAPDKVMDSDQALLREAKDAIAALNLKYREDRFLLFHRTRAWSESEQAWIGAERKRGKIEALNSFLLGEGDKTILIEGTLHRQIHFVITADADTQLPPGAVRRMIETIAHPMNRVQIDAATGIRRSGYAIIQPRVGIALPGASATRFTHLFADAQGTDPYSSAVSDAHQELFSEAMFHGKAIYDVAAFHRILSNRFPVETLLSHDLIEGAHVGVALASDIEVLENLPLDYPGFSKRQHRWIRGDWQIAAWAANFVPAGDGRRRRNPLSFINRWRILDNLRRSIVPLAALLLLGFGWFVSAVPAVWTVVLVLAVGTPAVVPLLDRWTRHIEGTVYGWRGAADDLKRALVNLAFLPHQAWINTDAVVRALYRRFVSRRDLLEWQTATDDSSSDSSVQAAKRQLVAIAIASAAALLILARQGSLGPTFVFLGFWIASPWLMVWLEKPEQGRNADRLGRDDTAYLHRLARCTWRYFDDLVGSETNWLPPDNTQLALRIEVAQRTSPTNIGLWFNSLVAAHDFGYLTTDELVRRCSLSFESIRKLERYEGHLLNWYDTRTLTPLVPQYVSTVDSGNLIASLWVLERGCEDYLSESILGSALAGIAVCAEVLQERAGKDPSLALVLKGLSEAVSGPVQGFEQITRLRLASHYAMQLKETQRWSAESGGEKSYWTNKLIGDLDAWASMINRYLQWTEVLSQVADSDLRSLGEAAVDCRREAMSTLPSLRALAEGPGRCLATLLDMRKAQELRPELSHWLEALDVEYQNAQNHARETLAKLRAVSAEANKLASEINMAFLYDPARRLFGIGYAVGSPLTFASHYDLLASECRLASLVAIAKGEVPVEHWFALGRARVATPRRQALFSWSGTMFEYLMPVLFAETFEDSLLDDAVRNAVKAQMAYGRQVGLPWGTSECAYSAIDANQTYQYRAFGVRELALSPDADPGPVVTPYASALALMVDPVEAVQNLHQLARAGAAGTMGFYEAIDYTRPRSDGKPGVVIFSYMAHHQGMTLLALSNTLQQGIVQKRFRADPRIRAVEALLCERVPLSRVEADDHVRARNARVQVHVNDRVWTSRTTIPRVHLSSNGRYSLMVTNNGGGYSRWNGLDVTRWRSDSARDRDGSYVWLRDLRGGPAWSPSPYPAGDVGDATMTFTADRAEFLRRFQDLEARLEIAVATGDDVELRRLSINNRSVRTRHIEITTYMELALASHAADVAHPLFAKMFVETEAPERGVLLAHRRPRSPEEAPIWVASVLAGVTGPIEFETDRYVFLGRNRDVQQAAETRNLFASRTGAVLDPIFGFRCRISLQPRERREIAIATIAGNSREAVMSMVRKYQVPEALTHGFEMAWTRAQLEFRYLRIGAASAHRFEELAGHLLYPNATLRFAQQRRTRSSGGQSQLWRYGISGDLPLLVATAADVQATGLIRELVLAHSYFRMCGLEVDFVILNREEAGYMSPVHDILTRLVHAHAAEPGRSGTGRVFLLNWRDVAEPDREFLLSAASVVLAGQLGPLQQQLLRAADAQPATRAVTRAALPAPATPSSAALEAPSLMGLGKFSADQKTYAIQLIGSERTPTAWANVIANEHFGTVVTEAGLGFTWNGNSQMNRLTPWHNDPTADPQSEVIYLRDDDTGEIWTPTPLPLRETLPYRVSHGQGWSMYEHESHGIAQELQVFVAQKDPVKLCVLRMTNQSSKPRNLSVTHFAEWVLGSVREQQQLHVATSYHALGVLLARQSWNSTFEALVAFSSASPAPASYTADRISFFGGASARVPSALRSGGLNGRCGPTLDPCAALQVKVSIPPGGMREIVFVLGQADSEEQAVDLAGRYRGLDRAREELSAVREGWSSKLETVQVACPHSTINALLNGWLLYQVLACRVWARSGMHQSGGAFGFRDQLQDCVALIYATPDLTRAHLLRAAARQFRAGDVQHWWHPETGLGVRTRCSDDLLWLPWAVARYLERTGDRGILEEQVTFLEGPELAAGEQEKLFTANSSHETAALREHCRLAIEHAFQLGPHGIPLFGNGDWNDGMNRVGIKGRGESVWLGWFLLDILRDWTGLMRQTDPQQTAVWDARAATLRAALEREAWDGNWYLRGFFDDGSKLGSHQSSEAQIDSISQSWAILSGQADRPRAILALESAKARLVHNDESLVQLLDPPFNTSSPHPGYIMGYPPGVRENGGQYTHAAVWLAQAYARLGRGTDAVRILQMLNPAERTSTAEGLAQYRGEPYAVAGDVSFAPGRVGIAGWTWYTGSAGWLYRVWLEDVLGFHLQGSRLRMSPNIPDDWPGFELSYPHGSSRYRVVVVRDSAGSAVTMQCDGKICMEDYVDLIDDGSPHRVDVNLGTEKLVPVMSSRAK